MFRRVITDHYRHVQYTRREGKASQLVSMKLEPGQEIGWEQHDVDQYLVIVQGKARLDTVARVREHKWRAGTRGRRVRRSGGHAAQPRERVQDRPAHPLERVCAARAPGQ